MSIIKCPECGKEVSDKAKYCVHCGYQNIQESKIKCPECEKSYSKDNEICPHCGYENEKYIKPKKHYNAKPWGKLNSKERQSVIRYRKENHKFWTPLRIICIVVDCNFILVDILSMFLSIIDDSYDGIFLVVITLGLFMLIILNTILPVQDRTWYESNSQELYEKGIIK